GVHFNVIDPAQNDGTSCLAFAGGPRPNLLKKAIISMHGQLARNLYLLHASAWTPNYGTPIGKMVVDYQDGTTQAIPVVAHQDVGNWWVPFQSTNARTVWEAKNGSTYVGLFMSKFAVRQKPMESIQFVP